jgi:hypothetical protein
VLKDLEQAIICNEDLRAENAEKTRKLAEKDRRIARLSRYIPRSTARIKRPERADHA